MVRFKIIPSIKKQCLAIHKFVSSAILPCDKILFYNVSAFFGGMEENKYVKPLLNKKQEISFLYTGFFLILKPLFLAIR